jgi:hypothetical protein
MNLKSLTFIPATMKLVKRLRNLLNQNSFIETVKCQPVTKGFVQLGRDVEAIIGSTYPSFSFGGRNSAGQ